MTRRGTAKSPAPKRGPAQAANQLPLPAAELLAGLKMFFLIADRWTLAPAEVKALLGARRNATVQGWRNGQSSGVTAETAERLSHLVAIFRALQILFPDSERADAWVRKQNNAAMFSERSALDYMVSNGVGGLAQVRRYLSAETLGSW